MEQYGIYDTYSSEGTFSAWLDRLCANMDDNDKGTFRGLLDFVGDIFTEIKTTAERYAKNLGTKIETGLNAIYLGKVVRLAKWTCSGKTGGKGFVTKFFLGTSIKSIVIRQAAVIGLEAVSKGVNFYGMNEGLISWGLESITTMQQVLVRTNVTIVYLSSMQSIYSCEKWAGSAKKAYQAFTHHTPQYKKAQKAVNELIVTAGKCLDTMIPLAIWSTTLLISPLFNSVDDLSQHSWTNWSLPFYPTFSASLDVMSPGCATITAVGLGLITALMRKRVQRQAAFSRVLPTGMDSELIGIKERFEAVVKAAANNGCMREILIIDNKASKVNKHPEYIRLKNLEATAKNAWTAAQEAHLAAPNINRLVTQAALTAAETAFNTATTALRAKVTELYDALPDAERAELQEAAATAMTTLVKRIAILTASYYVQGRGRGLCTDLGIAQKLGGGVSETEIDNVSLMHNGKAPGERTSHWTGFTRKGIERRVEAANHNLGYQEARTPEGRAEAVVMRIADAIQTKYGDLINEVITEMADGTSPVWKA